MNPMGIFGGTFDPIHYAHLRTAFELQQALRLKEIRFLPAGNPPHRDQPVADAQLRLKMVELATAGQAGFVVDDREVRKEGPSYSVETLGELRHEYPDRSLCLIVGMDAFLSLPKWHQWQELLQLAHLVVAHRPGWRAPGMGPLGEFWSIEAPGASATCTSSARAASIFMPSRSWKSPPPKYGS